MGRRRYRPRRRPRGRPSPRPLGLLLLALGLLLPFLLFRGGRTAPLPEPPALNLPADLSPARRAMVENAAALAGRVGYFWGGKSLCLGWDPRWGVSAVVTAEGSDTTGKSLPFGLDCSGLVTWAAVNAAGTADALEAVGNGVRDQRSKCAAVPWDEARPGDLAFFPDLSHVGVVLGFTEDGALRVVHCSKTLGGVVISGDAALTGFTEIGRPDFYGQYPQKTAAKPPFFTPMSPAVPGTR